MANQIIKEVVNQATKEAKGRAIDILKTQDKGALTNLVKAELAKVIIPLEDEIKTTKSWWVKVRNRMYITVLPTSTGNIVKSIEKKLTML